MATSGTVGLTTFDVANVIEHAARRCGGIVAPALTGEMLQSARDNLSLILLEFVTKGMTLWTVKKTVYPLVQGQGILTLDLGTEKVERALYRTVTQNSGTLAPGVATYAPPTPLTIAGAQLDVPSGSYSFVLEGSPDNISWTQYGARAVAVGVRATVCFDADSFLPLDYWRVRELLAGTVVFNSAVFYSNASEIPATPISQDSYTDYPNKSGQGSVVEYWEDKQLPQTVLRFQRTPPDSAHQYVVWARRQIQDVGDLTNTLELPSRWLNAAISALAPYIYLELPKEITGQLPPDRFTTLQSMAVASLMSVMGDEHDDSPVRLSVNIRGYTR